MGVKQVICVRKDLHMRLGKTAAQCSHASMKVLLDLMNNRGVSFMVGNFKYEKTLEIIKDSPLDLWLSGLFTKIVVSVNSEAELLKIYTQAKASGILCSLILDSGLTEFKGIPTYTCCAIGPDEEENINKITGELPLL